MHFRPGRLWEPACNLRRGDAYMPDTIAGGGVVTEKLMKDISAAFNARDVDRIVSYFAEDGTFLMARGPEPDGRRVKGREAIRKVLSDRFKVIPDMRWDHIEYVIAGNRAVSVWMVRGKGADGEDLNYKGCDIYEFRGDKILNKDTYWKTVEKNGRL
jgi:ketosteroid isomerase-like protein